MIQECCFPHDELMEHEDRIKQAFNTAASLWYVHGFLAYNRLIRSCAVQKIIGYEQENCLVYHVIYSEPFRKVDKT
jgi:hypothetical protein